VTELIDYLEVEERARPKYTRGKGIKTSGANMVQKKNSNAPHNNKKYNNRMPRSPSRQPHSKRRTQEQVVLFVGVLIIEQVPV
jgi:hypothetical protein